MMMQKYGFSYEMERARGTKKNSSNEMGSLWKQNEVTLNLIKNLTKINADVCKHVSENRFK